MGGIMKSAGGLLGLSSGPQTGADNTSGANAVAALADTNNAYSDPGMQAALAAYANGTESSGDVLGTKLTGPGATPYGQASIADRLAGSALTGSKFATEQVQKNPILGSLFGEGGQLQGAEGKLNDLQSQGFNLTQGDNTLYGQESGQIANQFGQQGNDVANNLAMRGLSSSGAAGAAFSGIAGNQNEMLANAQQQIAQQRFKNTQDQIAQQQGFISSLGGQAETAINQQYGRQAQGAGAQQKALTDSAAAASGQNATANNSSLNAFDENVKNTPDNAFDMFTPMGIAKAGSMFAGSAKPAASTASTGAGA